MYRIQASELANSHLRPSETLEGQQTTTNEVHLEEQRAAAAAANSPEIIA